MSSKLELIGEKKVELMNSHLDSMDYARLLANRMQENGLDDAFAVMNLDSVVHRYFEWTHQMGRVQPFYAVKCNSDPVLLELLSQLGCGFDCASKAEIAMVRGLVEADRIIYANPCKTTNYIRYALNAGIQKMTFDSSEELYKICEIVNEAELILRIRADDSTAECSLGAKFGCDGDEEAIKLLELAAHLHQKVVGISFHVGSGCHNPFSFRTAIEKAHFLFEMAKEMGHEMKILDIGGGFPGNHENEELFGGIANVVSRAIDEFFPDPKIQIMAEPGRYFASSSMAIIANVIASKKIPISNENLNGTQYMYYLNDGLYGSFNCIVFDHQHPHCLPLFASDHFNETKFPSIIFGPTCDSIDCIEPDAKIQKLEVGDWLYYPNMGAYTLAAASNFNGFSTPKIYYFMEEKTWWFLYGEH